MHPNKKIKTLITRWLIPSILFLGTTGMLRPGATTRMLPSAPQGPPVTWSLHVNTQPHAGETFKIVLTLNIEEHWHIYAPTGNNDAQGMIETRVRFKPPEGMSLKGDAKLPKPHKDGSFDIYEGKNIQWQWTVITGKTLKPGSYIIPGEILYQTCKKDLCFPPRTEPFTVEVTVR